ncbi:MAG: T9SS type A sorting domain-containing protein [Paludibacteraceae bacterium]|nr:T9SS type A sorting domain-containing protein [Paludibacteraceae bacterium]
MKTTSTIPCLLFSVALTAQVTNLPTVLQVNDKTENAFSVVPKELSYDGSNLVYIRTADDQIAIYGNDFTPVKSITITPTCDKEIHITKEREVAVTVTPGELISSNVVLYDYYTSLKILYFYNEITGEYTSTYNVPTLWTEDSVKTYLETQENLIITSIASHPDGGILFTYDMDAYQADGSDAGNYFMVDTYGKQYPESGILWQNGYLYSYYPEYSDESVYAEDEVTFEYGEWVEVERSEYSHPQTYSIGFTNYDANHTYDYMWETGDGVCLTQTLFNSDDKYEYLYFPHELSEEYDYGYNGPMIDHYESGTYTEEKTFYQYSLYKSFNIMSEDGAILQTVTFPNGFQMVDYVDAQVIQLSEEFYILCQGEMNDSETLLIYKINRSSVGASVEQVCAPIKVGVYPNLVNRNQTITIQLSGDNVAKTATDVEVVNMSGQVTDRQTISAGQTQTQIRATKFSTGMNVVNLLQNGKTIGTQRVIVK